MKVLYSRNCLLMYKDDFKTESIKLTYDDKIPSEFVHVSLHVQHAMVFLSNCSSPCSC